jgi:uncharacterized protein (DUF1684 family)
MSSTRLELTEWRRRVAELYAAVRATANPEAGHALWRTGRDGLFRGHPQSPLLPDDPLRETGLPYWPYDPRLRFEVELQPAPEAQLTVPTGEEADVRLQRIGLAQLGEPLAGARLDVWWLDQYGGGMFIPMKDATAGTGSYGAGRYLLDTAKSADLGGSDRTIILDLNFAYHPSCRYNPRWVCPLAQAGNILTQPVEAGERLTF